MMGAGGQISAFWFSRTQENVSQGASFYYGILKDASLRFAKKFLLFSRNVGWPWLPRLRGP